MISLCGLFDQGDGPANAVFGADACTDLGGARLQVLIADNAPQGGGQSVSSQLPPGNRVKADAQFQQTTCPERLITGMRRRFQKKHSG